MFIRYNYFGDNMNKQKKLVLGRSIFVFIIFVAFGVIILTEKMGDFFIPKITNKMNDYIEDKYNKEEFNLEEVKFKNTTYTMKVISKENKHHYFYIKYFNKKITDTYQKDYKEGKNLLDYLKDKLKKEIMKKTSTTCELEITSTLDKYTDLVRERIIKEDNLLGLKFFIIKKELVIEKWDSDTINKEINSYISKYKDNNITPKSYTITITFKSDITKSIEIKNITEEFTNNTSSKEIIDDIINDEKSDLLKENKITYKYLN